MRGRLTTTSTGSWAAMTESRSTQALTGEIKDWGGPSAFSEPGGSLAWGRLAPRGDSRHLQWRGPEGPWDPAAGGR